MNDAQRRRLLTLRERLKDRDDPAQRAQIRAAIRALARQDPRIRFHLGDLKVMRGRN